MIDEQTTTTTREAELAKVGDQNAEAVKLNAAFDLTGITFHSRATALAKFRQGREIVFENGEPYALYDSETLPLADALTRWAYDVRDPALYDGRTLPRSGAGIARPGLQSKADFPDLKSKVAFIGEHGEDAWSRLPLTGLGTSEVLTQDDWYRLPSADKVRRLTADPNAFVRLPKSAKVNPNIRAMTPKETIADNLRKHIASKGR